MRRAAAFCAGVLLAGPAWGERVEIPIHQTQLPDGELRYSIPIVLGSTAVEAMLDTGSTGVRVLPGTLAASDYTASSRDSVYSYGSGAELKGVVAQAILRLGGRVSPEPVSFEAVETVDCIARLPHCPASRIAAEDYGIGGSGMPKQGFKAIIGTLFRDAEVANPLIAMGIKRWIVILPRPGEAEPGKLVLDPGADETADFTMFRLENPHNVNAVPGCLLNDDSKAHVCGRVLLDTGAPGLNVKSRLPIEGFPWGAGAHATLVLQNDADHVAGFHFTVGMGPNASLHLEVGGTMPFTRISGSLPFYSVAVLYDAEAGAVGVKSR